MSAHNHRIQVIKDPVYGSMQFSQEDFNWLIPFIDSENFQRLRHIKQAGLADWFFIGAVHTRFNHSLGCCYVASQIAEKMGLRKKDKQTVMLACLLHDIGHGPFSHAFEHVFDQQCIRHERWTPYFIKEFSQTSKLAKNSSINQQTFALIERIIMHQEKQHSLFADIVSSQLDADRLDYLLRDSLFCGVTYGQYDLQWLLSCLTPIRYRGKTRLGITSNGVGVVEQYLMARRLMTRNVYHHHKKYAAEHLVAQFLQYLAEGLLKDEHFRHIKRKTLAQFIMRVNEFNASIKITKNKERMIKQFLQQNYEQYKQMGDYDIFSMIRHCANLNCRHPAAEIARALQQRRLPHTFHINAKNYRQAKTLITAVKTKNQNLQNWQIMVLNLPNQSYRAKDDPILVIDKNNKIQPLDKHSLIMNALSDQWEHTSLVYIDDAVISLRAVQILKNKLKKLL